MGRILVLGASGDHSMTLQKLNGMGYDSVRITGRNGDEYVVYEPSRVRIVGTVAASAGVGAGVGSFLAQPAPLAPLPFGRPMWSAQGMAGTQPPPITLGPMFGSPFLVFRG
jgi:hypothetical protein